MEIKIIPNNCKELELVQIAARKLVLTPIIAWAIDAESKKFSAIPIIVDGPTNKVDTFFIYNRETDGWYTTSGYRGEGMDNLIEYLTLD